MQLINCIPTRIVEVHSVVQDLFISNIIGPNNNVWYYSVHFGCIPKQVLSQIKWFSFELETKTCEPDANQVSGVLTGSTNTQL